MKNKILKFSELMEIANGFYQFAEANDISQNQFFNVSIDAAAGTIRILGTLDNKIASKMTMQYGEPVLETFMDTTYLIWTKGVLVVKLY